MKSSIPHVFRAVLLPNLCVAIGVYLAAWGSSLLFRNGGEAISTVWPTGGIALAAVLLLGFKVLPGVFIPLCVSSVTAGNPLLFSLLGPAGVGLAVWLGASLLIRFRFDTAMSSTRDILMLAGVGSIFPMGIAGLWISLSLLAAGLIGVTQLLPVAGIYWTANAAGVLISAPVVLLMASRRVFLSIPEVKAFLICVIQVGLVAVTSWVAFSGVGSSLVSFEGLAYLPFPFVVWAALSGGLPSASISVVVVVLTAAGFTSRELGPFSSDVALETFWQSEVFIAIIASTGLLIGAGSDAQRREKRLLAEASTREAELERLKAQVNPHFLFNCLTAIQSLVRTDGRAAEEGLSALSSLLRKSLDVAKEPLIPLGEELGIIRDALRLQKMRFEEGLEWSIRSAPEAETFRVPPMLLQPLVENAVKHGVCDGFGQIDLEANLHDGELVVTVRNTAPAICDPAKWNESVGLASVRARIASSCPKGSILEFSRTSDGTIQALARIKPMLGTHS
jgi:integral membrane sensor domain MASE1